MINGFWKQSLRSSCSILSFVYSKAICFEIEPQVIQIPEGSRGSSLISPFCFCSSRPLIYYKLYDLTCYVWVLLATVGCMLLCDRREHVPALYHCTFMFSEQWNAFVSNQVHGLWHHRLNTHYPQSVKSLTFIRALLLIFNQRCKHKQTEPTLHFQPSFVGLRKSFVDYFGSNNILVFARNLFIMFLKQQLCNSVWQTVYV